MRTVYVGSSPLIQGAQQSRGRPLGWDALTHLCFSKYLRFDRTRSAGFVGAATALLDAGASANTGFYDTNHRPAPEWESALYGAAGVAHHAELTRLLLGRCAEPNDEEVPYHAPESYDNAALTVLVESGKLNADSLTTMLLRKADWHDYDGIKGFLPVLALPMKTGTKTGKLVGVAFARVSTGSGRLEPCSVLCPLRG